MNTPYTSNIHTPYSLLQNTFPHNHSILTIQPFSSPFSLNFFNTHTLVKAFYLSKITLFFIQNSNIYN
ncbi:hypothetical protein KFK09_017677 [Dendrobium nobile]|uniref:Uncharacterized protein n=1 Tax=Dendrobium nobile TaxID=94219 RepID=A0A8T3ASP5_DENNO|nr:hypothetical protein KFK09_017677 [Dendrobium nobile]